MVQREAQSGARRAEDQGFGEDEACHAPEDPRQGPCQMSGVSPGPRVTKLLSNFCCVHHGK